MKHERNSDFSANEIDLHNEGHGEAPVARSPAFLLSPFSRREQVQLTGLVMLWACTVTIIVLMVVSTRSRC